MTSDWWRARDCRMIKGHDGRIRLFDATGTPLGAVVRDSDAELLEQVQRDNVSEGAGSALLGIAVASGISLVIALGLTYVGFQIGRTYERVHADWPEQHQSTDVSAIE